MHTSGVNITKTLPYLIDIFLMKFIRTEVYKCVNIMAFTLGDIKKVTSCLCHMQFGKHI